MFGQRLLIPGWAGDVDTLELRRALNAQSTKLEQRVHIWPAFKQGAVYYTWKRTSDNILSATKLSYEEKTVYGEKRFNLQIQT